MAMLNGTTIGTDAGPSVRALDQQGPDTPEIQRIATENRKFVLKESARQDIITRFEADLAEPAQPNDYADEAAKTKAARESGEQQLLELDADTILQMLRDGKLQASDITPAVSLKLQDEMQGESLLSSLISNYLKTKNDSAMASVRNLA